MIKLMCKEERKLWELISCYALILPRGQRKELRYLCQKLSLTKSSEEIYIIPPLSPEESIFIFQHLSFQSVFKPLLALDIIFVYVFHVCVGVWHVSQGTYKVSESTKLKDAQGLLQALNLLKNPFVMYHWKCLGLKESTSFYFSNKLDSFNKVCAWVCFHHISKSSCGVSKCCVNSVISSFSCLPVTFDVSFAILTKHCWIVVATRFIFYHRKSANGLWIVTLLWTSLAFTFHIKMMFNVDWGISWSSCGVYGCVCRVYVGMPVCLWFLWVCPCVFLSVCVFLSEVLCRLVGVNGWDLSTRPLSETHMHHRSNETVKAVGSPITILCSCHLLFLNVV